MEVAHEHFTSVQAFAETCKAQFAKTAADSFGWRKASIKESPKHEWDLGCNQHDAVKLLEQGWPEGVKLVKQASLTMLQRDEGGAPAFYNAESGPIGFAAAALAGDPECYLQYDAAPLSHPVVKLVVSINTGWQVEARDMVTRGAVTLSLISALEAAGVRVELTALSGGIDGDSGKAVLTTVVIKDADQDVNLHALAVMLAHPVAYRRFGFAHVEKMVTERFNNDFDGGYGSTFGSHNRKQVEKLVKSYIGGDVVLLPTYAMPEEYRGGWQAMMRKAGQCLIDAGVLESSQLDNLLKAA